VNELSVCGVIHLITLLMFTCPDHSGGIAIVSHSSNLCIEATKEAIVG